MSLIVRGKSALVERFILTQFFHLLSLDITSYSLHFRMSVPQFFLLKISLEIPPESSVSVA